MHMKKRPVAPHVRFRPLARQWLRGPAWQVGDDIVMDCARAEAYAPLAAVKNVGLALTAVRTVEDAVKFVSRYGLLRSSSAEILPKRSGERREPAREFLREADELRQILRDVIDARKAAAGDRLAMARLRQDFPIVSTREGTPTLDGDDRTVQIYASDSAAFRLSQALAGAKPYVFDRAQIGESASPGLLRVGVLSDTLVEVCYLTVALSLADKEPIDVCPECQRAFVVEDARQRFCRPACASRSRSRRFTARQERDAKKEKSDGKKTRKK